MKKKILETIKGKNFKEMKSYSNKKVFGLEFWKIKILIPLLGIVVVILMSYGLVFAPKLDQIREFIKNNKQMNSKTEDINQRRAYIQSIDDAELIAKKEILLMALPESKDIYFLLNVMSGLVSEYGFTVDSFSMSPGELKENLDSTDGGVSSLKFSVNLVGPSSKYVELINGLENSLPILSLNGLESESISSEFVKIDLGLTTYFVFSKDEVDIEKLTYKDLLMSQDELTVLERLNSFRKIEDLFLDKNSGGGKQFQEYEIRNTFLSN